MTVAVNGARFILAPRPHELTAASQPSASPRSPMLSATEAAAGLAMVGLVAARSLLRPGSAQPHGAILELIDAHSAAVLAVLVGVNAAVLSGRGKVPARAVWRVAATLAVRAVVLGAVGLALGYSEFTLGVVFLPYYALLYLLAIPLVLLPTWAVCTSGLILAGGVPVLTHHLLPLLPLAPPRNPIPHDLHHEPLAVLSQLSLTGVYPGLAAAAIVCAGVLVGRVNTGRDTGVILVAVGFWMVTVAGTATWLVIHRFGALERIVRAAPAGLPPDALSQLVTRGLTGNAPAWSWWWLGVDAPHANTPPELVSKIGTALGLVGLMLLVGHLRPRPLRALVLAVWAPLAGLGGIVASAYTVHVLFINSDYDHFAPWAELSLQAVVGLSAGLFWRLTAGRDPLDALLPWLLPPLPPATSVRTEYHARHPLD